MGRRLRSTSALVLLYALVLAAWWIIAAANRSPSSPYLDPPQLLQSTWTNRSVLLVHLEVTAEESALGFLVGAGIALVLSLVAVRFPAVGRAVERVGLILYSLPLIAIAPLMVIWIGAGLATKVVIAAFAAFFPVLVNAMTAFASTDRRAVELMEVVGASQLTTSLRVRIPYALPAIFASFAVAAPAAVIGATVAEWVGAERGLGVSILAAMQSYDIPLLWSSILVVSILSLLSYALFAVLGRLLFPWHASSGSAGASS